MARQGTLTPTDRHAPLPTRTARSPRRAESGGGNFTEREDRRHIAVVIASHPHYLGWLQDRIGAALDREAQRLVDEGHTAAAGELHNRAAQYRSGELDAL